jgi:hypothetical protein
MTGRRRVACQFAESSLGGRERRGRADGALCVLLARRVVQRAHPADRGRDQSRNRARRWPCSRSGRTPASLGTAASGDRCRERLASNGEIGRSGTGSEPRTPILSRPRVPPGEPGPRSLPRGAIASFAGTRMRVFVALVAFLVWPRRYKGASERDGGNARWTERTRQRRPWTFAANGRPAAGRRRISRTAWAIRWACSQ